MKKSKHFQISTCLQTLFEARYFHNMSLVGINTKSVLTSAIYQKCLTISSAGMKSDSSTGQLVNLMSVDTQKIVDVLVGCFTLEVHLLAHSYLLRKSLLFKGEFVLWSRPKYQTIFYLEKNDYSSFCVLKKLQLSYAN
jgi:hypothetical protein